MRQLHDFFMGKKNLILGLGLEGKSTLRLLEGFGKPAHEIILADKNPQAASGLPYEFHTGDNYLNPLYDNDIDVIMKSPGIALRGEIPDGVKRKITCQTDLLLRFCPNKIIGITGTKGKSTVSALTAHVLNYCDIPNVLIGNIGVPPLEFLASENYDAEAIAVCEMSCHQLEYVAASPNIAVFLNLYEEHLDHYGSFENYRAAKENIFLYQTQNDLLIFHNELSSQLLLSSKAAKLPMSYSETFDRQVKTHLPGRHNQYNIAVALEVCRYLECDETRATAAVASFTGLPHRLEFVGRAGGAEYINDSISTIPAAAISAVRAFPGTDTLIIGGMDRSVNYAELVDFLPKSGLLNLIALPDSGHKIAAELQDVHIDVFYAQDMLEAVNHALKVTKTRCILSPAAASYGFYRNFEERGEDFKRLVNNTQGL
ncbi:MAG: UDP-N-acetylmuramoyl-L-alanine--D-glutamate ligase [Oscillospiraceae bacterium]|nr:UDP-N-acetylmuramoyl-L-alanine--D-glutamate ligase [Oscillospiraceae bacterium]